MLKKDHSLRPRLRHYAARLGLGTALCAGTVACSNVGYIGTATSLKSEELSAQQGWLAVEGVKPLRQKSEHDCGITALTMVLRFHGYEPPEVPASRSPTTRWSAGELKDTAQRSGAQAFVVEGKVDDLVHELQQGRPVIVGTTKPTVTGEAVAHYEVVVGLNAEEQKVATLDPAAGLRQNSYSGFLHEWLPTGSVLLVVLPGKS